MRRDNAGANYLENLCACRRAARRRRSAIAAFRPLSRWREKWEMTHAARTRQPGEVKGTKSEARNQNYRLRASGASACLAEARANRERAEAQRAALREAG